MKFCIPILFLLFITSCTPIYLIINKQKVKENDKQISDLTNLIMNDDYKSFLSKLTINNDLTFNKKDTLGFGYYWDADHRCFNDVICFNTHTIRYNDSIISMLVYPSFSRVKPIIAGHYKRKYKKAGWKIKRGYGYYFEDKIYGFHNSTLPISDKNFTYRPKPNLNIDSLMTPLPLNSNYYFNSIKDSLTENDLLYLLHSISPSTRLMVVKHIKCNNIKTNTRTDEWIRNVIEHSPRLLTRLSKCVLVYKPIEYFLDCE